MTSRSWRSIFTIFLVFISLNLDFICVSADADFRDVRNGQAIDRSGKKGDPKDKYFHESVFDPHYDGRFASKKLGVQERQTHLRALIQTFLATMADIGAETWIMHGTLMGWWWNQRILPWDDDLDVQVSETTISFLAKYYNMTEYHYLIPGTPHSRTYLLEINPHYIIRDQSDKLNVIDGRWIDTTNGLFIDISTVRPDLKKRAEGIEGALMVKDRHKYLERDIFPLRDSFFEGIHVKIPFEYSALLTEEYGQRSLVNTNFRGHRFNGTSKIWEPIPIRYPTPNRPVHNKLNPIQPNPTQNEPNQSLPAQNQAISSSPPPYPTLSKVGENQAVSSQMAPPPVQSTATQNKRDSFQDRRDIMIAKENNFKLP